MHQHNINLGLQARKLENTVTKPPQTKDVDQTAPEEGGPPTYVTQFGFHTNTCCGFIPQENAWSDDWLVSGEPCDRLSSKLDRFVCKRFNS